MQQYGNTTTYNLESVLLQNIKNSHFYIKKALDLDNVHELIDEIYETVDHVEPWLSGNARGPSSAFCLLYRLGQLKPSPPDLREMLDHKDSPYIRALGLLYLRFCADPRDLWKWFRRYVKDSEEFFPSPGSNSKAVTIGTFARDILLDQYYFETLFPRIPKNINDEIVQNLRDMGLPTKALGNGGQGGPDRRGVDDGMRRPASVKASLSVALGQRAPNRAGAREEGRGLGVDRAGRGSDGNRIHGKHSSDVDYRSRRRSRSRSRDRTRSPSDGPRHRDYRGYDRERRLYRKDDRYDGRYERGESFRSRHPSSRSPTPEVSKDAGRDVADVFREKPGPMRPANNVQKFY